MQAPDFSNCKLDKTLATRNVRQLKEPSLAVEFEQIFACLGTEPGSQINVPVPDILKLFGIRFHFFAPKLAFVTGECLPKRVPISFGVGHAHGQETTLDKRKGLLPMPR